MKIASVKTAIAALFLATLATGASANEATHNGERVLSTMVTQQAVQGLSAFQANARGIAITTDTGLTYDAARGATQGQ